MEATHARDAVIPGGVGRDPLASDGGESKPDFEVGLRNERAVVEQECMWAEPVTRELQVRLTRSMHIISYLAP